MTDALPPLRILVDAIAMAALPKGGPARLCQAMIPYLMAAPGIEVLVLDRGGLSDLECLPTGARIPFPMTRNSWSGPADSALIQKICDHYAVDVMVGTLSTTPLRTPLIAFAHDMPVTLSGVHPPVPCEVERDLALGYADSLLCLSSRIQTEILAEWPERPAETCVVAPPGVARDIFMPAAPERIEAFRSRHRIVKDYVLCVDSTAPQDPAGTLEKTLAALMHQNPADCDLVCIGTAGAHIGQTGDVRLIHLPECSDADQVAAYSGACALSHPGSGGIVGLPVLEAMACGCPVITTADGTEAVQDAALIVPDNRQVPLALALARIADDSTMRDRLIRAGLAKAATADWGPSAERLVQLIRTVAAAPRDRAFHNAWEKLRAVHAHFI